MTGIAVVKTTAELYPPKQPEDLADLLWRVPLPGRDEHGNFELRRGLVPAERAALGRRVSVLVPWLTAGGHRKVMSAVLNMLLGFGKTSTMEEAQMIATQFATALHGIPIWAVERACIRFATAAVSAEEIGEKTFNRSYPPSSAQLRIIALEIMRPFAEESVRIGMTLRGSVPKDQRTAEEKAGMETRIAAWNAGRSEQREQDRAARLARMEARRIANADADAARQRAVIDAEYRQAGLDPPAGDNPVSLALRMRLGWCIEEEPDGRKVLVAPAKVREDPVLETNPVRDNYDKRSLGAAARRVAGGLP